MTHAYGRGFRGWLTLADAPIVLAWLAIVFFVEREALRLSLLVAIPIVLGWGIATLHFPSRVDIDDDGVAFFRYGRAHRFAWTDVSRVRVRRFLVRDRVLVRIEPSSPWRGRYWIVDSIERFDVLVATLEARARLTRRASAPPAS